MEKKRVKTAFFKTSRNILSLVPMVCAVLLFISLLLSALNEETIRTFFTGDQLIDPLLGASIGSIAAGNPVNSYIIGAALSEAGVSLLAVTAFIVCWASVGVVQAPMEAILFGKRFTLVRNLVAFLQAIGISIFTVYLVEVLYV